MIAAALLALPAGAADRRAVRSQPDRPAVRPGTGGLRQEGLPQALRREAHDAQLHQADTAEGRGGRQLGDRDCQQELAQSGAAQFILDYAWDEDTVDDAMSECIDLTLDDLLALTTPATTSPTTTSDRAVG